MQGQTSGLEAAVPLEALGKAAQIVAVQQSPLRPPQRVGERHLQPAIVGRRSRSGPVALEHGIKGPLETVALFRCDVLGQCLHDSFPTQVQDELEQFVGLRQSHREADHEQEGEQPASGQTRNQTATPLSVRIPRPHRRLLGKGLRQGRQAARLLGFGSHESGRMIRA